MDNVCCSHRGLLVGTLVRDALSVSALARSASSSFRNYFRRERLRYCELLTAFKCSMSDSDQRR